MFPYISVSRDVRTVGSTKIQFQEVDEVIEKKASRSNSSWKRNIFHHSKSGINVWHNDTTGFQKIEKNAKYSQRRSKIANEK